jgi:hypothetical protein
MALLNKIVLLISPFILLFIVNDNVNSQTLTSSPYSRYGIGEMVIKGFGRNKAMGNTGIALRSPYHLNNMNPASYSSMDSVTFIYEFGITGKETQYNTKDFKTNSHNANINFFSIGFPVSRFWFSSFGLVPFSNFGYDIKTDSVNSENNTIENIYSGTGGINQFYFGNSIKLFKKFSFGFHASYLFGSFSQLSTTSSPGDVNFTSTSQLKDIKVSDFYFDYGMQYTDSFAHKYSYNLGFIFNNETKIHTSNTSFSTSYLSSYTSITTDTLINTVSDSHFLLPYNVGIGFSMTKNNNLSFGIDYILQNWASSKFYEDIDTLVNSNYLGFGIEYVPDINSVSHYASRIRYRLGGHYSNTYLKLKGTPINDYGISFGFGFPFRKTKTTFNISFELGTRGTTKNNLIKENYGIISFNLTFFDNWFIRKRFE